MDALAFLHQRFGIAAVAFAVLLGIWGTFQFLRYRRLSGGFRSSFLLLIGLVAVQGLIGLGLLIGGKRPGEWPLHIVYGIFGVVFLPGMYFYSERRDDLREAAILAASSWIVTVALLRGLTTG